MAGITRNQISEEQEGKPNKAQTISMNALTVFNQGGVIERVSIAPFAYVEVAEAIGKEVDFQVLYGRKPLDLYGLPIFVTQVNPNVMGDGSWTERDWYHFHFHGTMDEEQAEETLIVKIARTWEACSTQCERGFPCPLLAVVGKDVEDQVLDACGALRDVEKAMTFREEELAEARVVFEMEARQEEGNEDDFGRGGGAAATPGGEEHQDEDEG